MLVCGLDFETNSLDPQTTLVTEVGAALYSYDAGEWVKVRGLAAFCYEPHYPLLSQDIVEITGITDEMLMEEGKSRGIVFAKLIEEFLDPADLVVAHKIAFDKKVLESTCETVGLDVPKKEWLCTLSNFPWRKGLTCHKLGHLGWEHGLNFPAASLHRAEQDVDLMMALVEEYDFSEVLKYMRTPWVYLRADVVGPWVDGGKQNGIAKSLGFSWEQVRGDEEHRWPKNWVARCKEHDVKRIRSVVEKSISPFRVSVIEGV
jgi:hypothetical protein